MADLTANPASARQALILLHRLVGWRLPPAVAADTDAQQVMTTNHAYALKMRFMIL